MNETKSELQITPSSCDNNPTEAIRNHTTSLEALLKEIYSNHKETIRLCREEQKEKFTKIVALKNKMFERGKEIQKECNVLKKENQDLKEAKSSRNDVPCKTCDHLRRSFDSLEEAYKRSLSEKDKMIRYLEAQLNGQQHSFNSSSDCVSPNSTSPDNQKNNRLRLKSSQKRVVYKGSSEENPVQVLPLNKNSNSKPSPAAPLMDVPETCLPDTCAANPATRIKAGESDDETTVVPDTLALFNPWDSDGETDENLSTIPEEIIEKSLVLESPYNKLNTSSNTTLVGAALAKPQKNLSLPNGVVSDKKTVSNKDISIESNNGNQIPASPQLAKTNNNAKNTQLYEIQRSHLEGCFKSPSKSPMRKKRKQSTYEIPKCDLSLTKKGGETEDKTDRKEESALPLQCTTNSQIIERPSFELKKSRRRSRSKENQDERCEVDADLTLPPDNWGNETLMNDSDVSNPPVAEHNPVSPHKTDRPMTQMNGSLAPSMQMTQFLEENEVCDDQKKKIDSSVDPKGKTTADCVEVQSCSQTFPSSYKFGAVKSPVFEEAVEDFIATEPEYEPTDETLCDSFDHVPKEKEIAYAHHAVVRKKAERRRLNGYTCRECVEYYRAKGLSEDEIQQQLGDCSRHRAKYEAPQTPEHFWSVGFPDTLECERRGYFTKDEPEPPSNRKLRRRRRLKQLQTDKCEEGEKLKTEADEQIGMTQMLEYLSAESGDED